MKARPWTAAGSLRCGSRLLAVAVALVGCAQSGDTGDGGSGDGSLPSDAATTGPAIDAGSPGMPDTGAPSGMSEAGSPPVDASALDSDTDAPSTDPLDTDWASWPMPNPASSDFPNPASYDTSVAGVVVDKVTGLMWQQTDVASSATSIDEAAPYCAALRLAGYADWRLPSRIELWSIEDFMLNGGDGPALDPAFSTISTQLDVLAPWTTTPNFGGYQYDGLIYGSGDGGPAGSMSVDSWLGREAGANGSVRCVRGSSARPSQHYTVQNGTVFDNGTKLTWQQGYDPLPSLPDGVASYCASLTLAGGGWRGPSVKELETIVDDTRIAPSLDTSVFQVPPNATNSTQDMSDLIFYTATPWEQAPDATVGAQSETLYVDFVDGSNGVGTNTPPIPPFMYNYLFQVRCVR